MRKCPLHCLAASLVLVGGINWGLVGLFKLDVVASIFGPNTVLARIIYILIGAAAVFGIFCLMCHCRQCNSCCNCPKGQCKCNGGSSAEGDSSKCCPFGSKNKNDQDNINKQM